MNLFVRKLLTLAIMDLQTTLPDYLALDFSERFVTDEYNLFVLLPPPPKRIFWTPSTYYFAVF